MARKLPPPPTHGGIELPPIVKEWLNKLYQFVGDTSNLIQWNQIDTSGSELSDISTRPHSELQNVVGSSEQVHVSTDQYNNLTRTGTVTTVSVDTTLNDTHGTVVVDTTAKTITLPPASTNRIGKVWTIIQNVTGYVDITVSGSDTIVIDSSSTTIRLDVKGASISLKCLTATSWGII